MIILVIDKDYVFAIERKCQPPIAVHFDRPMTTEFSSQGVQIVARRVHAPGPASHVQCGQEPSQPCGVHWLNSRFGAGFSEELQPFVAIAQNHAYSVSVHYTERKGKRRLDTEAGESSGGQISGDSDTGFAEARRFSVDDSGRKGIQ